MADLATRPDRLHNVPRQILDGVPMRLEYSAHFQDNHWAVADSVRKDALGSLLTHLGSHGSIAGLIGLKCLNAKRDVVSTNSNRNLNPLTLNPIP